MQPIIRDCTNQQALSSTSPSFLTHTPLTFSSSSPQWPRDSSIPRNGNIQEGLLNLSSRSIGLSFNKNNRSKRSIKRRETKENRESKEEIDSEAKITFRGLQPRRRRNFSKFCHEETNEGEKESRKEEVTIQGCFLKGGKGIESFIMLKKLGEGSFSQVFKVVQRESRTVYALKVMQKQGLREMQVVDRLASELKIQSFCSNLNIVKLYGVFHDEKRIYLIQEYAGDKTLYSLMEQRREGLQLKEVQSIVRQVCNAVRFLHSNSIIHRDIKPENIMIAPGGLVKLTDFGWSVYNPDHTLRDTICGTPLYLSPELINAGKYNESVDLWAIGVLTFQLLTGHMPFGIRCFQDLRNIITQDLDLSQVKDPTAQGFIALLLTKDVSQRKPISEICEHEFLKTQ